jgi:phosphodiesterase/alkaline phosphatase D-like protein
MKTLKILLFFLFFILSVLKTVAGEFHSYWDKSIERTWAGADYWTNPLQDWRVSQGRLECYRSGGERNVYLLTRELNAQKEEFEMSVKIGQIDSDNLNIREGWMGFRIGSKGEFNDYRDSAVRGEGLDVGLGTDGILYIAGVSVSKEKIKSPFNNLLLKLIVRPIGEYYSITIRVQNDNGLALSEGIKNDVHPDWLIGNIALVCSAVKFTIRDVTKSRVISVGGSTGERPRQNYGGNVRFWFKDWQTSGSKISEYEERAWGPILFAQYTLSRKVLKLTAQMAPIGNGGRIVRLQIQKSGEPSWKTIDETVIDPLSRTATFRISNWDDTQNIPYRLAYSLFVSENKMVDYYFTGTIAKDPNDKTEIVVTAFTGNNDYGFPHTDVVRHVRAHKPDLLVFTGDQIYEAVGGYGVLKIRDVNVAALDYLRKWYIFGWEYKDLLRELPSVCLPDDHDVFHGNVWGAGGRAATSDSDYDENGNLKRNLQSILDSRGGYVMPPVWVNMVQTTQTSHMPDPYDATPIEQGISVYYCEMVYGGISFAVIEDRKWKSAPREILPKANIVDGWAQNPEFNSAKEGDVPGAVLLGQRQLDFLENWASDWSYGIWMKAVISQTLFSNVATLPKGTNTDAKTPELRVVKIGEYVEGDAPVQDHDSDGWPQTGRNKALDRMRRAFAIHIAGDQHLGSTVQYGIDDWNDANYAICVPAVANIFPRRWFPPPELGKNRKQGAPPYTGDFLDGFGNKITVYAVSNPYDVDVEPKWINRRAPGYGIITFNRDNRKITLTNWPRWVDPTKPDAQPYPGWPITINQTDNYNRKAIAYLSEIEVIGMNDPVVQVIDELNGEIIYTLRIKGASFRPKVFKNGIYKIKVGEPKTEKFKTIEHLQSIQESVSKTVKVEF